MLFNGMLRFTLRHLGYFTACVEHGSVAAAATALNVSQPSISTGIAKLERQLGVQLLLRHHARGVTPSPNGERLLAEARQLLQHADELQRLATSVGGEIAGELRLGSFMTLAPAYLPSLIAGFTGQHPGTRLKLDEGTQDDLISGLRDGRQEAALIYDVDLPDDLRAVPLAEVQPHVLLPAGHQLAGARAIDIADLADEKLILLDVPPSRAYFLGILHAADIEPDIGFSSPSLELVRGMVGRGMGYSLLVTRPAADVTYEGEALAARPLSARVEPGRIALATLKQLRPTRLMLRFEEFCLDFFNQHAGGVAP